MNTINKMNHDLGFSQLSIFDKKFQPKPLKSPKTDGSTYWSKTNWMFGDQKINQLSKLMPLQHKPSVSTHNILWPTIRLGWIQQQLIDNRCKGLILQILFVPKTFYPLCPLAVPPSHHLFKHYLNVQLFPHHHLHLM